MAETSTDTDKLWYIVHTYSGFETKVKESLHQRAEAMGMADVIEDVLVPTEEVVEVRDGRKSRSTRKFFPGYVLVKMTMSDDAWHVVRNTPKVTGFVGTGSKPVPLSQAEVDRIVGSAVAYSSTHTAQDQRVTMTNATSLRADGSPSGAPFTAMMSAR